MLVEGLRLEGIYILVHRKGLRGSVGVKGLCKTCSESWIEHMEGKGRNSRVGSGNDVTGED